MDGFDSPPSDNLETPEIPETPDSAEVSESIVAQAPIITEANVLNGDTDAENVSPTMAAFATEFHELDSGMKGGWGERVVLSEIDAQNQVPLLDHWDEPNRSGFDAVSFDPKTGMLHVWEAKNWDGTVSEQDLTAWSPARLEPNQQQILNAVPESLARDQVAQALQEGRLEYHLRLGPETDMTRALGERIRQQSFPFHVDVASMRPETMLAHGSGNG